MRCRCSPNRRILSQSSLCIPALHAKQGVILASSATNLKKLSVNEDDSYLPFGFWSSADSAHFNREKSKSCRYHKADTHLLQGTWGTSFRADLEAGASEAYIGRKLFDRHACLMRRVVKLPWADNFDLVSRISLIWVDWGHIKLREWSPGMNLRATQHGCLRPSISALRSHQIILRPVRANRRLCLRATENKPFGDFNWFGWFKAKEEIAEDSKGASKGEYFTHQRLSSINAITFLINKKDLIFDQPVYYLACIYIYSTRIARQRAQMACSLAAVISEQDVVVVSQSFLWYNIIMAGPLNFLSSISHGFILQGHLQMRQYKKSRMAKPLLLPKM